MISNLNDFKFDDFEYMVYRSILPRKHEQINHRRNWGMYFIAEGSIDVIIKEETYHLEQNSYIFFDKDESYILKNDYDSPVTLYIITYLFSHNYLTHSDYGIEKVGHLESNNVISNLVSRLFNTWLERKIGCIIKCKSIFYNIIYNMIITSNTTNLYYSEYSKLQHAIRYIHSNYAEDIRIEDLCEVANYSQTHTRRLFLKYFGMSPVKYITKYRIDQAILLLNYDNDLSVTQIAHKVGFSDICYFSKIFKKTTGYTPLEYKTTNFS